MQDHGQQAKAEQQALDEASSTPLFNDSFALNQSHLPWREELPTGPTRFESDPSLKSATVCDNL